MKLSVVIPTYNEADNIESTLQPLQAWRAYGHEVIIADGGSTDATISFAQPLADIVLSAPKGRARQMNHGAQHCNGDALLFLHADTQLPNNALQAIERALAHSLWGRFNVRLSGTHPMLWVIGFMMNQRSRLTGIATGDQAIFISRQTFDSINGYADIPLMEDIDISQRLKKIGRPACLQQTLITSSRRWERHGILKTVLLMWRLRLAYFLGTPAEQLVKRYY